MYFYPAGAGFKYEGRLIADMRAALQGGFAGIAPLCPPPGTKSN